MDNARTLSGQTTINADIIVLPETINAITIKNDKGLAGQVLQKTSTNKLGWGYVDDIEIPDGSISGEKLKSDIAITTTGDIQARNITATNILKTETTLDLPNSITAINITDGGGDGLAGQVLAKNNTTNKLEWDYVDDITIEDRTIAGIKLMTDTITVAEMADNAITTDKILNENVTAEKLATDSVTTLKILDENVTADKLATNSVITSKILDANVTTDKLENGAVTNLKIADSTIAGGKLASDIAITTTGSIQAYEITATHRFIQTGTQMNTFAGGLTTSKGYLQTNGADINVFAGQTFLEKEGSGTPPTTLAGGGFALQVGDGDTVADVYIKRNLVVDGTIHGNIEGDITDTHIDCQSLVVEDKSDAGATGITVKDNYDIILKDNQAGTETTTIALDSSAGEVRASGLGFSVFGRLGRFDGQTVSTTVDGVTTITKTSIQNVDFSATNNWHLAGRTFTKYWYPVKSLSGQQVNWTYQAVTADEEDNNWYDMSGEADVYPLGMTPRGQLDLLNVWIKTDRVRGKITMNMACNYQMGLRLKYKSNGVLPITEDWNDGEGYLVLGDDWTDGDSPEYLGQKQWTWYFPVLTTTIGRFYSFRPEVFIKYAPSSPYPDPPHSYPVGHSRVQFWVGSAVGSEIPDEDTNSDMSAVFEITELPAEQTQVSSLPGTYPVAVSSSSSEEGG